MAASVSAINNNGFLGLPGEEDGEVTPLTVLHSRSAVCKLHVNHDSISRPKQG